MPVVMARTCLTFPRITNLYDIAQYLSTARILTSGQFEYYYSRYNGQSKTDFEKVPITGG
jgi:hypothetical protein